MPAYSVIIMFHKLQYISQGENAATQLRNIRESLDAGCSWIQLRYKQGSEIELLTLAQQVKELCDIYDATFIVNDDAALALATNADGVHLGLSDTAIATARSLLGPAKIIGGTANTLEQVMQRHEEACDYVGLGPFRFTVTKEHLSPVLGLQGYERIMSALEQRRIPLPVYAIGGILEQDVPALLEKRVYGIALSAAITHHPGKKNFIQQLNTLLYAKADNSQ